MMFTRQALTPPLTPADLPATRTLALAAGQQVLLERPYHLRLRCRSGSLWYAAAGLGDDGELQAGESVPLPAAASVLVRAETASLLELQTLTASEIPRRTLAQGLLQLLLQLLAGRWAAAARENLPNGIARINPNYPWP